MKESTTVIGCDVHKEKITAAVLPPAAARPTEILTVENHPKAITRFVKRLAHSAHPLFVYEAGPCGYELQRQITQLGHKTVVIAPALVPRRPGDRVKTNRRDAEKLARLYRAGELTEIACRPARRKPPEQQVLALAQTDPYRAPVQYLRCLKGIDTLGALTLVVETQGFRRFHEAPAYMSFTGLVCSEDSTGEAERRGAITKAGNPHLRRILVEAAWTYRHRNTTRPALVNRRRGCPPDVVRIARRAQDRLHRKFWRLVSRSKLTQIAVVAVARELAGFV